MNAFNLPGKYEKLHLVLAYIKEISKGKIPRILIHVPLKDVDIQAKLQDIDNWVTLSKPQTMRESLPSPILTDYHF